MRYAITRMMSALSAARRTTRRPTGTIIAPPMPCSTRATVSSPRLVLSAQRPEDTVNRPMAAENTNRAPKRSAIHPLTGMKTPRASR